MVSNLSLVDVLVLADSLSDTLVLADLLVLSDAFCELLSLIDFGRTSRF